MIQATREQSGDKNSPREPGGVTISDGARAKIRRHLEEKNQDGLVFSISTVPTQIGFTVQVGFDVIHETPHREEFSEIPVVISPEDWKRLDGFTIDERDGQFVTLAGVTVHVSETPNPEARKFSLNRTVIEVGSVTFHRSQAGDGPLFADLLFRVQGVGTVFCIQNFVTVTREGDVPWDILTPAIGKNLQAYFAHGGQVLAVDQGISLDSSGIEARIVQILEEFIRPQVQQDGGDVVFAGYNQGIVSLHMQGSCVGCPSSTATLKMGIENLLKDTIPEVQEVVAIS